MNDNSNITVDFSNKIVFKSKVVMQIYYVLENEAVDLQNKAKKLDWDIIVENDQEAMLKKLRDRCMNAYIALPDQKSLINYLMTVFDGERVAAKVKQFMCMIQNLSTDYMLKKFINANEPIKYKAKPKNTPGQDIAPKKEPTDVEKKEISDKFQ